MSHVRVRRPLAATLWLAAWLAPSLAPVRAAAQPGPQPVMPSLPRRDGKHDFEFAVGSWKVAEWRRRERTRPDSVSTSDILDAVAVWRPLADGGGMLEEYEVGQPDGRHVRHAALLTRAAPNWKRPGFTRSPIDRCPRITQVGQSVGFHERASLLLRGQRRVYRTCPSATTSSAREPPSRASADRRRGGSR